MRFRKVTHLSFFRNIEHLHSPKPSIMYLAEPTTELEKEIRSVEQEISEGKKRLSELRKKVKPRQVTDHVFEDREGNAVKLSDLFGDSKELILVSNMGKGCRYCTLWGDNYNGIVKPLNDRASFVVASPDSPEVQREFAKSRGWNFRMVSHQNNGWADETGVSHSEGINPAVASYIKDDKDQVYLVAVTGFGPGDNFCNMWDFIDLLPAGVNGWQPKYDY